MQGESLANYYFSSKGKSSKGKSSKGKASKGATGGDIANTVIKTAGSLVPAIAGMVGK